LPSRSGTRRDPGLVLQRGADADGLVVAGGADVIGGPGDLLRQGIGKGEAGQDSAQASDGSDKCPHLAFPLMNLCY
jgi:hypothetical protein